MKTKQQKREEALIRNENWTALSFTEKLFSLQLRPGHSEKQRAKIYKTHEVTK